MQQAIKQIKVQFPGIKLSVIEVPGSDTLNDFLIGRSADDILQLLSDTKSIDYPIIQTEEEVNTSSTEIITGEIFDTFQEPVSVPTTELQFINSQKIGFQGKAGLYYVLGHLSFEMGSLPITLMLEEPETNKKHTRKLDLFEQEQVFSYCRDISEKEGINANILEADLRQLSELLSAYRDMQAEKTASVFISNRVRQILSPEKERQAIQFLSERNLLADIDKLIAQSGVIGEENNRLLLYVTASSYKTNPLHVLVQGTSGSGKSHLINAIKDCLPAEEVINLTRVTSKSFYNYQGDDLVNKLIVLQDFDGLDEEAQLAFREAQSAKYLSSSTVNKDRYGNLQSVVKNVNAHFSSMIATTKAEVYFDNMSRSILIGVDESDEQTFKINQHQNKRFAGKIDDQEEQKAKELLQNCIRALKPYKVINPYADKLSLPAEAKMQRRLNDQFQQFIMQVSYLHQYQREIDKQGRVITTKKDIRMAIDLFFDAIWLKIDELDSSTRQFYERMKAFVKKQEASKSFSQKEIRIAINQSKSQCFRYFETLKRLEYITVLHGSANRGYQYRITEWNSMQELKDKIKNGLYNQIHSL